MYSLLESLCLYKGLVILPKYFYIRLCNQIIILLTIQVIKLQISLVNFTAHIRSHLLVNV